MSVPSLAYALQNNLDFIALSNLDAGLYQVPFLLFLFTIPSSDHNPAEGGHDGSVHDGLPRAEVLRYAMDSHPPPLPRGRRRTGSSCLSCTWQQLGTQTQLFSNRRFQLNNVNGQQPAAKGAENYFVGITAVLSTCVTAGFAGVYFEKMLKDGGNTPFWVRNMQMYSCGVVSAFLGCVFSEGSQISQRGFFYGYDYRVYAIVGQLLSSSSCYRTKFRVPLGGWCVHFAGHETSGQHA